LQQLDLTTADDKVLSDIRRYASEVQRIASSPISSVSEGIATLVALRKATYEDLNQIQHEYAALRAVRWLAANHMVPDGAIWQWNPRQTGNSAEPDIRAVAEGRIIVSGEVTTSPRPIGSLDGRMASTLRKLSEMEGRRYYFVLTAPMKRRAMTKVAGAGLAIEVVQLQDGELMTAPSL
jgi:hypothetical protein